MHFQLWFPGQARDSAGLLRANGLADFVEGAKESVDKLNPQTLPGLWITWSGESGAAPDRQRVIDCGNYSIVFWTDSPCAPEELQRRSVFVSYSLDLSDGNAWLIPKASELPADFRLVDKAWAKVRKPQFNQFWAESETWYRRLIKDDLDAQTICAAENLTVEALQGQYADFCTVALRQNYRVTREIVSELGLLDSSGVLGIIMRVVDGIDIREVLDEARERDDTETAFEKKAEALSGTPG